MTTKKTRLLSIVVPVFNEEESLPLLHEEITRAVDAIPGTSYEIIYIDDGSSDQSYSLLKDLYARDGEHVRVVRFRRNFGQTAAMAAGFDSSQGEIIIPMDADMQNDPADIPRFLEKIDEGYDVVSGWRANRQDKFISRKLPSKLANGLISKITGVKLHDYGCTLKAYHRDVAAEMHLYGELHRFLPALASWSGAKVAEIKVNHRSRQYGKSKYGISRTMRVVLDLITIKFLLSYSTKPMQVFGKWGVYSIGFGLLAGLATILLKIFEDQDLTGNPWMYACIFFLLSGLQLICMGLLGEISVRTYYESQNKSIYSIRDTLGCE